MQGLFTVIWTKMSSERIGWKEIAWILALPMRNTPRAIT